VLHTDILGMQAFGPHCLEPRAADGFHFDLMQLRATIANFLTKIAARTEHA
jgi:hypothetical protein